MANLVLLALVHLRVRLALVLKARVPAFTSLLALIFIL
jgi:hypothetical protein